MQRPLVTIISPTYNQERYVASCAESALAQTYPEWEQIFVDDGSTDGTREILASYRDPRLRVIALPHGGLAALHRSYNAALAQARGSLVAILEGDDLWPADKLAIQVPTFEDPDVFLTWGRADLVDERGHQVGHVARVTAREARRRFRAEDAFQRLTRANILTPTVTVMLRREALDRVGGFRQSGSSMFVDLPTWLWVTATQSGVVEFIDHCLGIYRVHGEQTSILKRSAMTREHYTVVQSVASALGNEALARVDWHGVTGRSAESRACLADGEVALEEGRYREARHAFLRGLRLKAAPSDVAMAAAGLVSSVLHVNLVRAAFMTRARLQRWQQARTTRRTQSGRGGSTSS